MELFDTHIHSEGRSVEDLKFMAENGIKKALTCAFYPIVPRYGETLIDLFRKLVEFEAYRGKKAGMEIYAAIGIHPRCIPQNWRNVLEFIELSFPEDLAVIDHASSETVEMIRKKGYYVGLTVQPGKLSVDEAVSILNKYGDERFIANSDTGFSESDMLAVRKFYDACRNANVTLRNAEKFLRI